MQNRYRKPKGTQKTDDHLLNDGSFLINYDQMHGHAFCEYLIHSNWCVLLSCEMIASEQRKKRGSLISSSVTSFTPDMFFLKKI